MTRLEMNNPKIMAAIKKRTLKAQLALGIQVLKDSNYYCPEDQGFLKASGIQSGPGKIEWNMPYASEQYYGKPNKSKDDNPNARMKWFEEAKAIKMKKWEGMANNEYHK